MRFLPIDQFQMEIATRLVREALKKLARQPKAKRTRHVLAFFCLADALELQRVQATPNQIGAAAEVNDTPCKALVHGNVRFASKRVPGIKASAIAANAFLVSQCLAECLSKGNAAVFHGMMGVNLQVAFATQLQVHHRVLGKERKHVIKERDAGSNHRLTLPIDVQIE